MVSVIDSEELTTEFDVIPDIEEIIILTEPRVRARKIYRAPVDEHLYAKFLGGLAVMVALILVPMLTLAGMMIPVLIAEVYMLDWTYSKFSQLRSHGSSSSSMSTMKSPEDEIDRTVARTGPKEQFLK
jgi:hypothetical protein